jgi:hypothetical protein
MLPNVVPPIHELEALFQALFGLRDPGQIPGKLGLGAGWTDLLTYLREGREPAAPLAPVLQTLYRAAYTCGAAERYLAIMSGVRFSLAAAGVRWRRRLGPLPTGAGAFDRALGKLRWEAHGLHLQRQVMLDGEPADWAIAGLLPTGEVLRVAIRVRPTPSPLASAAEDLADDRLAASGFELLGLREWQLRYAGTCALEVADFCRSLAPYLGFPTKLHDPDDDHPVHRAQARPERLTPREATPNFALREEARRQSGSADPLERYRAMLLAVSDESAEEGEAPNLG